MITTITAGGAPTWFAWGFFMSLGWTIGSWIRSKLLNAIG